MNTTAQPSRSATHLVVQADDLLQAAIYDSDLVMEMLALSSNRCRQTNNHLTLVLEALEALDQAHDASLERCCIELKAALIRNHSAA